MKLWPKGFFGLLAILLFLLLIYQVSLNLVKKPSSSLSIISENNRFKVSFDIREKDKDNFAKFLANLNIPSAITPKTTFELDATSQAMLTFYTPIKTDLNLSAKEISFSGQIAKDITNQFKVESIKIPKNTSLAVFAANVIDFLNSRYHFPPGFSDWLSKNFATDKGQYLIIFGPDSDFALIIRNNKISFDELKNIPNTEYKEDNAKDTNLHLLKISSESNQSITAVIFNFDNYSILCSSLPCAQNLLDVLKSTKDASSFPTISSEDKLAFTMLYLANNPISENFKSLLFPNSDFTSIQRLKIFDTLGKIEKATITLKASNFSGLIKVK